MSNMKTFAEQQLSKDQMSKVTGGTTYICSTNNGKSGTYQFTRWETVMAFLDMNGGGRCDKLY